MQQPKRVFSIPHEPSNEPKTAPVKDLSNLMPRKRRQKPQEETFIYVNLNLQKRGKFGSANNGVKKAQRPFTRATNVSSMRIDKSLDQKRRKHHHQNQIHDAANSSSDIGTKESWEDKLLSKYGRSTRT